MACLTWPRWSRHVLLLGLLFGCAAVGGASCRERTARPELPVLPVGGDFELTDHDGQPFRLASLRGKVVLIFFGYTSCPDACPTTLSKLSSVYRQLGADAARVKTLYITVDPARDTPAVLKAELQNFRVDSVGLTGTRAAIDKVVSAYAASYEVVSTPDSVLKYTVSHATSIYALDAEGRVRVLFAYDDTVDAIVQGIRTVLAAG